MFEHFEYAVAGRAFGGLLATPAAGPRGGILVCHGGSGITDHERNRVRMLAGLGFTAVAPDLFGETFADRAHGMRVIGGLVGGALRERVTEAHRRLADRVERTAAIGHCFGGLAVLELARGGADVRAVVSFHGSLTTKQPARPSEVRARVLVCTGADDPFCPREQRIAFEEEMTTAGVDWQHHVHGGARHGFSIAGIDPEKHPGCAYHELADRRSWHATLALLAEVMP